MAHPDVNAHLPTRERLVRVSIGLLCMLIVMVAGLKAQSPEPQPWSTYTVKGADFSVALPTLPAVRTTKEKLQPSQKERQRHVLKSASKDIVYLVQVVENPEPQLSLETFIKQADPTASLTSESNLTLDGIAGKSFVYPDGNGRVHFFATRDHLYEFRAFGVPIDDAGITKFFSSLSLKKKKESIEVSETVQSGSFDSDRLENVFTGKNVTTKARILNKPEAEGSKDGTGVVVLRCIFAADGTVTHIRVIQGVPGLTEKAIKAARKITFIPATKDGIPVSMWMQLEYNFDKYFVRD